jgi:uncharacterized protein YndB with AHSA1/START domain
MIDVTEEISAVRREVAGRVLEPGRARVVAVSRSYPAQLDDVWDACTNPERIPRWFLPVSGELKEGGRYQLAGNAGGTVTRCDPPHGFDATWEMDGDVSWIELRLTDEGNGRFLTASGDAWYEASVAFGTDPAAARAAADRATAFYTGTPNPV